MKVETFTSKYEFSHGRKPRGAGAWWFRLSGFARIAGSSQSITKEIQSTGSYTEARKEAERIAKASGMDTVEVLP